MVFLIIPVEDLLPEVFISSHFPEQRRRGPGVVSLAHKDHDKPLDNISKIPFLALVVDIESEPILDHPDLAGNLVKIKVSFFLVNKSKELEFEQERLFPRFQLLAGLSLWVVEQGQHCFHLIGHFIVLGLGFIIFW